MHAACWHAELIPSPMTVKSMRTSVGTYIKRAHTTHKAVATQAGGPVNVFTAGMMQWRRRGVAASICTWRTEEAKVTDGGAPMHHRMPLDPTDREPTGHLGAQSPPGARRGSSRRDRPDRIYDEMAVRRGYLRSSSTIRDRCFGAAAHQGRADAATRPRFIVTSAVVGATCYTRP